MDNDWISAAEVKSLADKHISPVSGDMAVIKRAEAGLVPTKAQMLIYQNERQHDCELPTDFWAEVRKANLIQNWNSGDFDTSSNRSVAKSAYGVVFKRSDIMAMLPDDAVLDQVSIWDPDENIQISSKDVVEWLSEVRETSSDEVLRAIASQCRNGHATSFCDSIIVKSKNRYGYTEPEEFDGEIPEWVWRCIVNDECSGWNWQKNRFIGTGYYDGEETNVRIKGLRFSKTDLSILVPEQSTKTKGAESSKGTPGRKPAKWWDSLWIEICRQLYHGELIPKKQADIENAMLSWLESEGESVSPATIRNRARPLWYSLETE